MPWNCLKDTVGSRPSARQEPSRQGHEPPLQRLVRIVAEEPGVHAFIHRATADQGVVEEARNMTRILLEGRELSPQCLELCRRHGVSEKLLRARLWAVSSLFPSNSVLDEGPYEILGVEPTADAEAVKKAFRKLCLECHPDLHQGDAQASVRFQRIKTAYDMISAPGAPGGAVLPAESGVWEEFPLHGPESKGWARIRHLAPLGLVVGLLVLTVVFVDVFVQRPHVASFHGKVASGREHGNTTLPTQQDESLQPREPLHLSSHGETTAHPAVPNGTAALLPPLPRDNEAAQVAGTDSERAPQARDSDGLVNQPAVGGATLETSVKAEAQAAAPKEAEYRPGPSPPVPPVTPVMPQSETLAASTAQTPQSGTARSRNGEVGKSGEQVRNDQARMAAASMERQAVVAGEGGPAPDVAVRREAKGRPAGVPAGMAGHARTGEAGQVAVKGGDTGGEPVPRVAEAAPRTRPGSDSVPASEPAPGVVDIAQVEGRLNAFLQAYTADYSRRDLNAFLSHFTPQARENSAPVRTLLPAYEENFRSIPVMNYHIQALRWAAHGEEVLFEGRFTMLGFRADGRNVASSGRLSMGLVPFGTTYRVQSLNYSFN
mgnify:CR=1 FL=1